MDDTKINFENNFALLDLAENNPENYENPAKVLRSGAGTFIKTFGDVKHFLNKLLPTDSTKKDGNDGADSNVVNTDNKSVATVINCLVKVLSRMYKTVTTHGKQIKGVLEQLASEKTSRDILFEELQKRYEDMEKRTNTNREGLDDYIKEQSDKTEKALEKKLNEEIEKRNLQNVNELNDYMKKQGDTSNKNLEKKLNDLEIKCDEGRQREMKGTIIVSSPERQGQTEATIRSQDWGDDNTYGPESELDMVLRIVYDKTGVLFPYSDVAACHNFGKAENHSFVLKI